MAKASSMGDKAVSQAFAPDIQGFEAALVQNSVLWALAERGLSV